MVIKMKKFKESMIKTLLPHIILTEAANRPIYGYDIIRLVRQRFGIYLSSSTVYPALNDLEKQGFIKSEWNISKGRPRKVYTLTTKGNFLLRQTTTVLAFVNQMIEVKAKL